MFQTYISLFPEFLLLLGLLTLLFTNKFRSAKTPKTFFTVSKIYITLCLLFTIVFYNRSGFPGYLENNGFTTLFKTVVYLLSLAWFYLSCKWFLIKNRSSLSFYTLGITSLLLLSFAVSAENLLVLFAAIELGFLLNFFLIRMKDTHEMSCVAKRYLITALFFAAMFALGIFIFYQDAGTLSYKEIDEFLNSEKNISLRHYVASALVLSSVLYMIGLAPFHFWIQETAGKAILPVSGYLMLIPVFAYFAIFVDLTINVFYAVYPLFKPVLSCFAVLSIFIGALGANGEQNMRKLFACSGTYHIGIVFLCLLGFNDASLLGSFVYLVTYTLSAMGIYTAFYGFKRKGEYLRTLPEISGISEMKPFISAACLVFMISLIGTPPLLGFLGKLSVMNNLVILGNYWGILLISLALLMLAAAYLRVIKVMYFDVRTGVFDRADKGIYICLLINIILVLISILNPKYLMSDVERILVTVF